MNIRYVLDTNTVSAAFWTKPPNGLIEKLKACVGEAAIPVTVWHELRYGCALLESGSGKRVALEKFLHKVLLPHFPLLDYDRPAAEWHARERARLRKVGKTPTFVDGQIAAVAAIRGATLVTRSVSDFEHFLDLEIASWISS